MNSFFLRNIAVIEQDLALKLYGASLCFGHAICFVFWTIHMPAWKIFSRTSQAICWPIFESCDRYRVFEPGTIQAVFWFYGAFALFAAGIFAFRRRIAPAYWILCGLEAFRAWVFFQDYRFFYTHHYMAGFLAFAFLLLPEKRNLLRVMLVWFYFWAGLLKLNRDWLNGSILEGEWPFFPQWIQAQCFYVAFLELVVAWGLLFRNRIVFWSSFAQFALFHAISWPMVDFFYPCMMASMLSILLLCRYYDSENDSAFSLLRLRRSSYVYAGIFAALQIPPYFYRGEAGLRGGGRMLYSLFMYNERIECQGHLTLRYGSGGPEVLDLNDLRQWTEFRLECQPLVAMRIAQDWCRYRKKGEANFTSMDLYLESRFHGRQQFTPVIDMKDFCSQNVAYHLFRRNEWNLLDRD